MGSDACFPSRLSNKLLVDKAVSHFDKLIHWFTPRDPLSSVLVKSWIMSPSLVPRSFVMRQMGGQRRSWTVPVYMLR